MSPTVERLEETQRLPIPLERAWEFFANPENLAVITPPRLNFKTTGPKFVRMHPGQILIHRVAPILGIPMTWVTEIKHVVEPSLFVDEQRFGPYAFWHHQHHFAEIPGGVEMKDVVHYAAPLGIVGRLCILPFVRQQLVEIFAFRFRKLEELFGKFPPA